MKEEGRVAGGGQRGGYVAGRVLSGMRAGAAFECSWSVPSKAGREKGRGGVR